MVVDNELEEHSRRGEDEVVVGSFVQAQEVVAEVAEEVAEEYAEAEVEETAEAIELDRQEAGGQGVEKGKCWQSPKEGWGSYPACRQYEHNGRSWRVRHQNHCE